VDAGDNSHVQIIQDFVSLSNDVSLTNGVGEIRLGSNAEVELITLQRENPATFHFSNVTARVGRDARLRHHVLTLGGGLVRNDLSVVLEEEGADCTLNGLLIGTGDQLIDNHTLVDHAVPHGTSRELYKGILGGNSRGAMSEARARRLLTRGFAQEILDALPVKALIEGLHEALGERLSQAIAEGDEA
jgi:Fe-S cluster assembly protein SufD